MSNEERGNEGDMGRCGMKCDGVADVMKGGGGGGSCRGVLKISQNKI